MNKYLICLVSIALSALLSGLSWDLGFKGVSLAFGVIATLSFSVMLQMYLDSGTKFVDIDNSRRIK